MYAGGDRGEASSDARAMRRALCFFPLRIFVFFQLGGLDCFLSCSVRDAPWISTLVSLSIVSLLDFRQVLTGRMPWEGLTLEDVSAKVSSGERPELPAVEGVTLDGYENFGDLVQSLWAQNPKARPALRDIARGLREPPPHLAPAAVAVSSAVVDDAEADVEMVSAEGEDESAERVPLEERAVAASEEGRWGEDTRDEVGMEEGEVWADACEEIGIAAVLAAVEGGGPWMAGDEAGGPGPHGACGGSATPSGSGGGGETPLAASSTSRSVALLDDGGSKGKPTTPLEEQSPACGVDSLQGGHDGVVKNPGAAAKATAKAATDSFANQGEGEELSAMVESGADFVGMAAATTVLKEHGVSVESQPEGMGALASAHTRQVEIGRDAAPAVDSAVNGDANAFDEGDGIADYADAMGSRSWIAPERSAAAVAVAVTLQGKNYVAMTPPRVEGGRQAVGTTAGDARVGQSAGSVKSSPYSSTGVALQSPAYTSRESRGYPTPLLSVSPLGSVDSGPSPPEEPNVDGRGDDGTPGRASALPVNGRRAGILMRPGAVTSSAAARSAQGVPPECPSGTETKLEGEDKGQLLASQRDPAVEARETANRAVAHRLTAPVYTVAPGGEDGAVRSGLPEAAAVAATLTAAAPPLAGGAAGAATRRDPPAETTVPVELRKSRSQRSPKAEAQLPDLSSPDASQLSATSRGDATVVLTPLPASAPPAPATAPAVNVAVVSPARPQPPAPVPAGDSSARVKEGVMVASSGGGMTVARAVAGGGGGGGVVASGAPSRTGAGAKLRGIASSLAFFRKRRKSKGGVESFTLQES